MDIRRLRYFVAAAEEENLHRAADRLHVVQPALSKQIAVLESELECQLFSRSKGRMNLTAAGRQFLADARQILTDMQLAKMRAQRIAAGQAGTVRIGFRENAGRSQVVSRAFSEFRSLYPEVELSLNQMTSPAQCDAIRSGELDAGFIYLSAEHDHSLEHIPITKDYFFLALNQSHPLARKRRIELRDLTGQPFIWRARIRNAYYSNALLQDCIKHGLTPKIFQESDSDATTLNLVSVGMGIGFVVAATADSSLPGVVLKPVAELREALTLALAWNPTANSILTSKFIVTVKKVKSLLKV